MQRSDSFMEQPVAGKRKIVELVVEKTFIFKVDFLEISMYT